VPRAQSENHPSLSVSTCTVSGGCESATNSVTIDSNWRWLHEHGQAKNCYSGNEWDTTLCPDTQTCTQNCALEGADEEYTGTYGVNAEGDSLALNFVTQGSYSKNVGSRTFLLEDEEHYKLFKLKNKEFTFDVDVSKLPCGLNGALYFVQMDADGGKAKYPTNTAGAKYGTGYCDAQCPHDLKWINGQTNVRRRHSNCAPCHSSSVPLLRPPCVRRGWAGRTRTGCRRRPTPTRALATTARAASRWTFGRPTRSRRRTRRTHAT
jgi:cellulose 1,4-beta-cellobiosidase